MYFNSLKLFKFKNQSVYAFQSFIISSYKQMKKGYPGKFFIIKQKSPSITIQNQKKYKWPSP